MRDETTPSLIRPRQASSQKFSPRPYPSVASLPHHRPSPPLTGLQEPGVGPARVMRVALARQELLARQQQQLSSASAAQPGIEAQVAAVAERRLCLFYLVDSVLQRIAKVGGVWAASQYVVPFGLIRGGSCTTAPCCNSLTRTPRDRRRKTRSSIGGGAASCCLR